MGRREHLPDEDQLRNRSGLPEMNVAGPRRRKEAKGAGLRRRRDL